ncbi:MAG TPA: TerB family tellurite resistance protein [Candidatus Limnocylindrales bacterium]|nr:TerB family tellurite resistance protein [Candidatus Limnocylindrales bacterium]
MFRRFLGLGRPAADPRLPVGDEAAPVEDSPAETATARRIVARLEALPPAEARYLACFAYVMSRAANAENDISPEETAVMEQFAVEYGGLGTAQAVLVIEMAKLQARRNGGTEDFVVTREFRSISTVEQRLALLRCCFVVGAADGTISATEAGTINEIARELDLEPVAVNAVRAEFHEQLSAVQALRRAGGSATA